MRKKKWKISGLSTNTDITSISRAVLSKRIEDLLNSINLFFENDSVENLHSIRISLRRLRYNMEIFFESFDKKKYMQFYKKVESLQDISGSARDLDVLKMNIEKLITEEKIKLPGKFSKKIDNQKKSLLEKLKIDLMKFTHSRSLKDFLKMIS
jgi:CHAD domain-containing protein